MQHDSLFFIGVFVFIFFVWLITGGPTHPLSFAGPLLAGPGPLGGGTYLSLPKAQGLQSGSNVQVPGSHASGASLAEQARQNQTSQLFGLPSTFQNVVYLSHQVSNPGSGNAASETIDLYLSSSSAGPVSISGWKLESAVTGNVAMIPQATEVPRSGIIGAIQPIILEPGDEAIISSGRSPIGASFRENVCIGYLANYQTFTPSLPSDCPEPSDDLARFYGSNLVHDQACSNYVNNLYECQEVLTPSVSLTNACQNFLTTYLNYNGCVSAHENDTDFKSQTWRIYLGNSSSMWGVTHDTIKLVDNSGKTVDLFSY